MTEDSNSRSIQWRTTGKGWIPVEHVRKLELDVSGTNEEVIWVDDNTPVTKKYVLVVVF